MSGNRDGLAALTASGSHEVLVELEEMPGVKPVDRGTRLGLYHLVILLPSRSSLGSLVGHLRAKRIPFGSSDHLVSEALYIADPMGLRSKSMRIGLSLTGGSLAANLNGC